MVQAGSGTPPGSSGAASTGAGGRGSGAPGSNSPGSSGTGSFGSMTGSGSGVGATMRAVNQSSSARSIPQCASHHTITGRTTSFSRRYASPARTPQTTTATGLAVNGSPAVLALRSNASSVHHGLRARRSAAGGEKTRRRRNVEGGSDTALHCRPCCGATAGRWSRSGATRGRRQPEGAAMRIAAG